MTNTNYVSMKELANEIGLDRSNMRKYVLQQGFSWLKVRTKDSGGQLVNALTREDADAIIELRKSQGFTNNPVVVQNGDGWFYIVQIVPELDSLRIKLGFATDTQRRLNAFRTISPTANLVKAWPCRITWERAAIDSATRHGCSLVAYGSEVYQCEDLTALVERLDNFFAIMPDI